MKFYPVLPEINCGLDRDGYAPDTPIEADTPEAAAQEVVETYDIPNGWGFMLVTRRAHRCATSDVYNFTAEGGTQVAVRI